MTVLNLAGPEYDFGHVVYAVVAECEHRRRSFDGDTIEEDLLGVAREKLAEIKEAYEEFSGSAAYWETLEREVLRTVIPQYADEARVYNELERTNFNVWRGGDVAARALFALAGITVGGIIVALPFIPIFEDIFAFGLAGASFFYPDLKRYMFERRHMRRLNQLVLESAVYQQRHDLHFASTARLQAAFQPGAPPPLPRAIESSEVEPAVEEPPDSES